MPHKILITGTAGFIGFHLVNRLLEEGNFIIFGLRFVKKNRIKYLRMIHICFNAACRGATQLFN
uniref:NAD-dependent epimerase/dehydratase family protein n=1 Tax=Algoriphagus sp. TaxID=1872435 RepID=UPI0040470C11